MNARDAGRVLAHETRRVSQTPRTFRNWPGVLGDMVAQRLGRGPAELTFETRTGLRISCPNRPGARVPIYEIFAEDCYRFEWFLGPLLRRPIQVLDIGGHVGTFACRLAQLHPQARIHSFEPSATTAAYLRRNAAANGFAERIEVTQKALAGHTGTAVFDDNEGGSGTNGLAAAGHAGAGVAVETVALDEVVAATPAPIDVVKMDCEGGEYDLVGASADASWASVARLVLEYHDVPGRSWPELRERFAALGLQVIRDEPVTPRLGTAWLARPAIT